MITTGTTGNVPSASSGVGIGEGVKAGTAVASSNVDIGEGSGIRIAVVGDSTFFTGVLVDSLVGEGVADGWGEEVIVGVGLGGGVWSKATPTSPR